MRHWSIILDKTPSSWQSGNVPLGCHYLISHGPLKFERNPLICIGLNQYEKSTHKWFSSCAIIGAIQPSHTREYILN
jgi:hypothetical protein